MARYHCFNLFFANHEVSYRGYKIFTCRLQEGAVPMEKG